MTPPGTPPSTPSAKPAPVKSAISKGSTGIVEGMISANRIGGVTTGRLLATLAGDAGTAAAGGGGGGGVGATAMNVLTKRGAGSSLSAVTECRIQKPTMSV